MAEGVRSIDHRPLGLVWIYCPHSVTSLGLEQALSEQARVHVGREAPKDSCTCIILCADNPEALSVGMEQIQESNPDGAPVLVFSTRLDLRLARDALQSGASGFIHAEMTPSQMVRAVKVATKGELVAPRGLLRYLIAREDSVDLDILSVRQREILGLVVEGLSNAQIGKRLFLSESTVKQHLRAAYKLLGVSNRTEAANLIRNDG